MAEKKTKKGLKRGYFWGFRRLRRRSSVTRHYLEHRESAREIILARLNFWNQFYGFRYNRVVIRNQRTCWGSCSSLKNLNFSYKLVFLPAHLQDYVVLHELCHLKELNHGPNFWSEMARAMPDCLERMQELRTLEQTIGDGLPRRTIVW